MPKEANEEKRKKLQDNVSLGMERTQLASDQPVHGLRKEKLSCTCSQEKCSCHCRCRRERKKTIEKLPHYQSYQSIYKEVYEELPSQMNKIYPAGGIPCYFRVQKSVHICNLSCNSCHTSLRETYFVYFLM